MRVQSGKLVDVLQGEILSSIKKTIEDKNLDLEKKEHFFKEGDFVTEFSASRASVREAIRSLEVRGFVERVHGRGVRYTDGTVNVVKNTLGDMIERNPANFNDVTQVRQIIEVASAGIAAMTADEDDIKKLEKCVETMKDINVSYEEYMQADLKFHRTIIDSTKNKILLGLISAYEEIIRDEIVASTSIEFRPEIDEKYHENVLNAIKDRNEEGAKYSMKIHLEATEKNIEKFHDLKNDNKKDS